MRCRHCGTENIPDAVFCRQCGESLQAPAKGKTLLPVLALCLALVVAAGVLMMAWRGSSGGAGAVDGGLGTVSDLETLPLAGEGEPPVLAFNDDGSLSYAQGTLSARNVADDEDARMVLGDLKGLLNIEDAEEEFAFDTRGQVGDASVYRFHQCYKGIPVLGKVAVVSVDGGGTARTIVADTIDVGNPSTEASVEVEEAFDRARQACGDEVISCRGLAFWPVEDQVELVWVVVCTENLCIVSATSGEVLAQVPSVWTMEGIDGVHEGDQKIQFNVEEADGGYQLVDRERNITYHDAESFTVKTRLVIKNDAGETLYRYDEATKGVTDLRDKSKCSYKEFMDKMTEAECMLCHFDENGQHLQEEAACYTKRLKDGVPIYEDSDNVWKDERALEVVSAINRAYDFYASRDWRGLNGHNHPLHVYLYDDNGGDQTNAGTSLGGFILVGTKCNTASNVLEHEYTHSVLNGLVRLGVDGPASPETDALHEAYADIIAIIINREASWRENDGARDLRNPDQSKNLHCLSFYDPDHLEKDPHYNGTIIGHAAYLMYEGGLTWDEMADLWCGSIWLLPPDADFDDCRRCVVATADTLGLSSEKCQAVRDAFDAVGVFDHFDTPASGATPPAHEAVQIPESETEDEASLGISEAQATIEGQSGKTIAYVEQMDFDADGSEEVFVIVGDPVDGVADAWSDAELWFASKTGEVSLVAGSGTFDHALRYIDTFSDGSSPHAFLSVENTAFGSGAPCHVYTVRNGDPVEVAFDQEGVMWVRGENGTAKGTVSVWQGVHKHQDYLFNYNEEDNTFYTIEEVGGLY